MRAILCLLSLTAAVSAVAPAHAADRYGPANPYQASRLASDYAGPLLGWNNKAAAPPSLPPAAATAPAAPMPAAPFAAARPAQALPSPARLPTSLYDPPAPRPAAPPTVPYAASRPTGQPIELAASAFPPAPSLARQQAEEEDAAVLAARMARADALAAQGGKPQTRTDLMGGP